MQQFTIDTHQHNQVVDLTDRLNKLIKNQGLSQGLCYLTVLHTTCCLTTADLDPGTDQDLLEAINKIFPEGDYRHPHDPDHVGEHIMSAIIGSNIQLPIKNEKLLLGTWQRVVLVELSGPRQRKLVCQFSHDTT